MVVSVVTALVAVTSMVVMGVSSSTDDLLPKKPAVFKIGMGNNPHCTAFVISDTLAVTAEHCVQAPVLFFTVPLKKVNALDDNNNIIKSDLNVRHTSDERIDIALLEGDFSDHERLSHDPNHINLESDDEYLSCGYPYGTKELVCSKIRPYENYMHMYKAKGYIVYGFSGGPVINITKGVVVGVNSAISEDFIIITPLTGIRGLFNLP